MAPRLECTVGYWEVRSVASATSVEAMVTYTRMDLSIAEGAALLKRSYTAVAGFLREYRQRLGDPHGFK